MKIEISRTLRPTCAPQTEAMPNSAEKMPPVSSMPMQPSGEMRNSSRKLSPCVSSKVGDGVAARRIGMKARLTSTEGITNSVKSAGSATFSSTCALTMPIICTIM